MLLAQTTQTSFTAEIILPLLPWLIIFVFVWFFVFRYARRMSHSNLEQFPRRREHEAAVEAKLDRLIELVEQRNARL